MYPDQSLYPADSVPNLIRRLNNSLLRADQIHHAEGRRETHWLAPLIADAEAGFGGNLNAFEIMTAMIETGAAGVHFEDQLSSAKKCGHLGGKVLVPTVEAIQKLVAARLAADVLGVPTVLIARTDAEAASLLTNDVDPRDHEFITGDRTAEGYFRVRSGTRAAIARAISYAPYVRSDLVRDFDARHSRGPRIRRRSACEIPGKMLAYNCSPSFNWRKNLDDATIASFQRDLGYKFQFITLAGFHALNHSMFELARGYKSAGMTAYCRLQDEEFESEDAHGYEAVKHQQFVGTGYFDAVQEVVTGGTASTMALQGSTEAAQFADSEEDEALKARESAKARC